MKKEGRVDQVMWMMEAPNCEMRGPVNIFECIRCDAVADCSPTCRCKFRF